MKADTSFPLRRRAASSCLTSRSTCRPTRHEQPADGGRPGQGGLYPDERRLHEGVNGYWEKNGQTISFSTSRTRRPTPTTTPTLSSSRTSSTPRASRQVSTAWLPRRGTPTSATATSRRRSLGVTSGEPPRSCSSRTGSTTPCRLPSARRRRLTSAATTTRRRPPPSTPWRTTDPSDQGCRCHRPSRRSPRLNVHRGAGCTAVVRGGLERVQHGPLHGLADGLSNPYMDPSPNDPELPYILMHLQAAS